MRHIPSGATTELPILTFEEALRPSPEVPYDREKWLYVPDFYSEYRYILGTRGQKPLICVGINPSTAKPDALDRTLQSVERVAHANGFDSFVMFNVYAQRATSPDDMEKVMNPLLHAENMKAFAYVLQLQKEPCVWAAWGAVIEKRSYLADCVRDMIALGESLGTRWLWAEPTKAGHPHHPLYLRSDAKLQPFDPAAYLTGLKKK